VYMYIVICMVMFISKKKERRDQEKEKGN
jgi:hypothetical protein